MTSCDDYKSYADVLSYTDGRFDKYLPSLTSLNRYIDELKKPSLKNQNQTFQKLAPYLLKNLNKPFLSFKEVESIMEETGLGNRQIRDFFRNQRKRRMNEINGLIDNDFDMITKKIDYLFLLIQQTISDLTNNFEDSSGKSGDILEFPM